MVTAIVVRAVKRVTVPHVAAMTAVLSPSAMVTSPVEMLAATRASPAQAPQMAMMPHVARAVVIILIAKSGLTVAKAAAKAGVKIVLSPSVMATSLVGILVEMLAAIKASPVLRAALRVRPHFPTSRQPPR